MSASKPKRKINPYIAGAALGGDRGFFGRENLFQQVDQVLSSPNDRAVILYGQRRIGKTSVLLQLERRLSKDGYALIFYDLMDKSLLPLSSLLFEIASRVQRAISNLDTLLDDSEFDDEGEFFLSRFLPQMKAAYPERKIIFLFDEFDVLDTPLIDRLDNSVAAKSFFPFLRKWISQADSEKFVFVVGRKPEDLSIEFLATFKSARSLKVSVLSPNDCRALIASAERDGSLIFDSKASDSILAYTAGHPFLTQLLCQVIWHDLNGGAESMASAPKVYSNDVSAAIDSALESGANQLQWIWDGLPSSEKVILAALAEIETPQEFNYDIKEELFERLVPLDIPELNHSIEHLLGWEILAGNITKPEFKFEIFRIWIQRNYPLNKVKDLIDEIDPLAQHLFELARSAYKIDDLDKASFDLERALSINPNHFKARILRGQIAQELGDIRSAVGHFEIAYKRDRVRAVSQLVKAYIVFGQMLESSANIIGAFEIYMRVLDLSPDTNVIFERISRLEPELVSKYIELHQWERALDIYGKLSEWQPYETKWNRSKSTIKNLWINDEGRRVEESEKSGEDSVALAALRTLIRLEPENPRWQSKLTRLIEQSADKQGRIAIAVKRAAELAVIGQSPTSDGNFIFRNTILSSQESPVNTIGVDGLGMKFAVGYSNGIIEIRDIAFQEEMIEVKTGSTVVSVLALSSRSDILAFCTSPLGNSVNIWDVKTKTHTLTLRGHLRAVTDIKFIFDDSHIITSSWDGTLRIWNIMSGRLESLLEIEHKEQLKLTSAEIQSLAVGPDNKLVAALGRRGIVLVWDLSSRTLISQRKCHETARGIAFDRTGNFLMAGTTILNLKEEYSGRVVEIDEPVMCLDCSIMGNMAAWGSSGGTVYLGDISPSGGQLKKLRGHSDKVSALKFVPGRKALLSTSEDGTTRLWEYTL